MSNVAPLHGLSAIVTGAGASTGLAAARMLARDGASVLLTGLDERQLADAARSVRATAAPDAIVEHVTSDACDELSVAGAVGRACALPGRFAICVSAVGHTLRAVRSTAFAW